MVKKIFLYLCMLFGFAAPVFANNIQYDEHYNVLEKQYDINVWGNEKDRVFYDDSEKDELQRIRKISGIIWQNKDKLQIEAVDLLEDSIVVTIVQSNATKEETVKNFVHENFIDGNDVKINFKNLTRAADDLVLKECFIADGIRYIACEGKLLELKHGPYMKNGFLMLPVRDISDILSKVSVYNYSVNWVGGNDEILEITSSMGGGKVEISVKNNQYKSTSYSTESIHTFEGTVENINGTVYLPYSPENLRLIFYVPISDSWNEQTRLVRLLF